MSTATTTATSTAIVAVPETAMEAVEKPVRKFPPPCWTQEETLALIDAYRDRWYTLRRGYLRTADWDAVAAAVSSRCPDASPAKTSAQCRHKMEKLRQRYRAEKQRSLTYPTGRFFSSWFFFENMDAMENGTPVSAAAGSNPEPESLDVSGNGTRLKTLLDQNIVKLKLNPKKGTTLDDTLNPSFALGHGFRVSNPAKDSEVKMSSNFESKVLSGYNSYLDMGSDKEEEEMDFRGGFGAKNVDTGLLGAPVFKMKNFGNAFGNTRSGYDGGSDEFNMKSLGDESSMPPRIRLKRTGKISRGVGFDMVNNDHEDSKDGPWMSMGPRKKYGGNLESDIYSRGLNGFHSSSKKGFEKKVVGGDELGEGKRGRSAVDEMVSAIKMLGEGFMKMENMKMEMAREMEKNRMEMEVKRNEMILESQRQIVDTLAKGLLEIKSKKMKVAAAPET